MPIQLPTPSSTITLTYTCTHVRIFRIEEVTAAAYEASTPLTTNAEGETLVFAPPGQGDVFQGALNLALMSAGERERRCPACEKAENGYWSVGMEGEEWEEVRMEDGEKGWEKLKAGKGEVLFDVDAESHDGKEALLPEREEAGDGEGWWDLGLLDMGTEEADAEMVSDDEDVVHGQAVKPYEVV
ncbi:MAG: hypothetical protein Q9188_001568 [Gyalolechia gomerana]